jgi:hypothetical protein
MRVVNLRIENFRSFVDSGVLELDQLNVFLGPNNAGKSTVVRALYLLQAESMPAAHDVRLGTDGFRVTVGVQDVPPGWQGAGMVPDAGHLEVTNTPAQGFRVVYEVNNSVGQFPASEPDHFIYPFLSGRKTAGYEETVNATATASVGVDLRHLPAKLARLANPDFPAHERYRAACERTLGFVVTAIPSPSGMRAGVYVPSGETIPLEAMGEGVANIVGMVVDLSLAEQKLFLVEEPENDIHPKALKALLELVVERSEENQFVVSTHSNIVARYLGSTDKSTLYYVDAELTAPPTARCRRLGGDPAERIAVLSDLGYELYDFDLWDGWLILEESSAERIIRDYLIPWFAPKLRRIRTVASGGSQGAEPTFDDFHRLFRFTHLEARYRNRAWVIVDGDAQGKAISASLRERYGAGGWDPDHFRTWSEKDFERFYPAQFADEVEAALATADKREKREAKRALLEKVRAWCDENPEDAREAFAESAPEVVTTLQEIEGKLFSDS